MKPSLAPEIRKVLKGADGMTSRDIALLIEKHHESVRKTLKTMPDAYIDRWAPNTGPGIKRFTAIWMLAEIPEDCPHP